MAGRKSLKEASRVLDYETLSASYEQMVLSETAEDKWISEEEMARRKLFCTDELSDDFGDSQHRPAVAQHLPKNAVRLQAVTAHPDHLAEAVPGELMEVVQRCVRVVELLSY